MGGEAAYLKAKCDEMKSVMCWQFHVEEIMKRLDQCDEQTFIYPWLSTGDSAGTHSHPSWGFPLDDRIMRVVMAHPVNELKQLLALLLPSRPHEQAAYARRFDLSVSSQKQELP